MIIIFIHDYGPSLFLQTDSCDGPGTLNYLQNVLLMKSITASRISSVSCNDAFSMSIMEKHSRSLERHHSPLVGECIFDQPVLFMIGRCTRIVTMHTFSFSFVIKNMCVLNCKVTSIKGCIGCDTHGKQKSRQ